MIRKLSPARHKRGVITAALVLAASLIPMLGAQAASASLLGPVVQIGEGFGLLNPAHHGRDGDLVE